MEHLACAWCGDGMDILPDQAAGACKCCGRDYVLEGNLLSWNVGQRDSDRQKRPVLPLLLRQLSPTSSRLSPLRLLTDWRVNQYYRRTLNDMELAGEWSRHNLEGLKLSQGAAVLDHGCGRGRHSAFLRNLGFRVSAQDIFQHSWWRELPDCFFQNVPADATHLPWRDGSFALVFDFAVIHYLTDSQLTAFIAEVFRVLAPGGYWILIEPNDESYGVSTMTKIIGRLHSLRSVRDRVEKSGFKELDISYEGFFAPALPLYVDFIRKTLSHHPYDVNDFRSSLPARIPPVHRKHWRLRMVKPGN